PGFNNGLTSFTIFKNKNSVFRLLRFCSAICSNSLLYSSLPLNFKLILPLLKDSNSSSSISHSPSIFEKNPNNNFDITIFSSSLLSILQIHKPSAPILNNSSLVNVFFLKKEGENVPNDLESLLFMDEKLLRPNSSCQTHLKTSSCLL